MTLPRFGGNEIYGDMVELADAPDLESGTGRCVSSSLTIPTCQKWHFIRMRVWITLKISKIQTFVKKVSPRRGKFAISTLGKNVFSNTVIGEFAAIVQSKVPK